MPKRMLSCYSSSHTILAKIKYMHTFHKYPDTTPAYHQYSNNDKINKLLESFRLLKLSVIDCFKKSKKSPKL